MAMNWQGMTQLRKDYMHSGNDSVSEREYCIGGIGVAVTRLIFGKSCSQYVTGNRLWKVLINQLVEDIWE